jgi:hypothetical protein
MVKMTIELTDDWATLVGVKPNMPVRIWRGVSEKGTPVTAYVFAVAVQGGADESKYEEFADLVEYRPAREVETITLSFAKSSSPEDDAPSK